MTAELREGRLTACQASLNEETATVLSPHLVARPFLTNQAFHARCGPAKGSAFSKIDLGRFSEPKPENVPTEHRLQFAARRFPQLTSRTFAASAALFPDAPTIAST